MRVVEIDIVTNVGPLNAYVDRSDSYKAVRRLDLTQGDDVQFEVRFFTKSGLTYTQIDIGETAEVDLICRNIADMFGDPLFGANGLTRTADGDDWKWVGTADLDTVRIANSIVSGTLSVDGQMDVISTVSAEKATYANVPTRIKQTAFGRVIGDFDTEIATPANDDLVQYDGGSQKWVNQTVDQVKVSMDLDSVDNTSDDDKPVSTAQQTAIEQAESDAKAFAVQRANHTGTQTASTISDFDTAVSNSADVAANTSARHDPVTVADSAEIDFTLTGQQISASIVAGSIDESKLDASVNASLDLADSALQSVSESDVTQHESALTITASQVSDFDAEVENNAVVVAKLTGVEANLSESLTGTDGKFADTLTARKVAGARALRQQLRQWAEVPSAQNLTYPGGFNYGLNDFWVVGVMRVADGTPSATADIAYSHVSGNNRFSKLVSIRTDGKMWITWTDGAGVDTATQTITLSSTIPDNTHIRYALTVDRDGSATFTWFDENGNTGTGSVSVAAAAAIDIGSGNTNKAALYNDTDTVVTHAYFETGIGLPSSTEADAWIYEGQLTGSMSGTGNFSGPVTGGILQPTGITPLQITSATGWNADWAEAADVQPKSSLGDVITVRYSKVWSGTSDAIKVFDLPTGWVMDRQILTASTGTPTITTGDGTTADVYGSTATSTNPTQTALTIVKSGAGAGVYWKPTASYTGTISGVIQLRRVTQ